MKHFNFFKQFFELTTFFPFKYLQHFSVVRLIELSDDIQTAACYLVETEDQIFPRCAQYASRSLL